MFKGILPHSPAGPRSRQSRRLAVVAERTSSNRKQQMTHKAAVSQLAHQQALEDRQRVQRSRRRGGRGHQLRTTQEGTWQDLLGAEQSAALAEEKVRHAGRDPLGAGGSTEARWWADAAAARAAEVPGGNWARASGSYDSVDTETGESVIQTRFNELVRVALLQYGPPLPAEFVSDNDVVTSSSSVPLQNRESQYDFGSSSSGGGGGGPMTWRDLGADGDTFMLYDEATLTTYELLAIIRKVKPDFSFKEHCDGVPFSLLIKNCPYLRAFGGKVNYMRYLRRETCATPGDRLSSGREVSNRVVLSITKYKMREAPSQDGIRQGPQPWRYSSRMI